MILGLIGLLAIGYAAYCVRGVLLTVQETDKNL